MEYPSNSAKAKPVASPDPEERKLESVVAGPVTRRKKPLGRRFTEAFIGGDAPSVWGYVVGDVLVPAARDMLADALTQGFERMIYGEARSTGRRAASRGGQGYTSYNRYSSSTIRREDPRPPMSRRARSQHEFDEIILATRAEAEEVLDNLFQLIEKYGQATVGDLYELVDLTGNYTDDKWGWSDLRGSNVRRTRNGYLLDLPKPDPID